MVIVIETNLMMGDAVSVVQTSAVSHTYHVDPIRRFST